MSQTSSMLFCVYKKLSAASVRKKLLKQADYIKYLIARLTKYIKLNMQISSDSF